MTLFQQGNFRSNSGLHLDWKVECDALSDEDWDCLAMIAYGMLPPFGAVEGVPTGGLRFAEALSCYTQPWGKLLIADDVCTTGASLEKQRGDRDAIGVVAFVRSPYDYWPAWVTPIWTLHKGIW